jgi:hypothetical protein
MTLFQFKKQLLQRTKMKSLPVPPLVPPHKLKLIQLLLNITGAFKKEQL